MPAERYVPRMISELASGPERRVCLVGTVKSVEKDGNFVLEDKNGVIKIISDSRQEFIKTGAKLRVFATNFDGKVKADVVQDLGGVDMGLFDKVSELCRKAGIWRPSRA